METKIKINSHLESIKNVLTIEADALLKLKSDLTLDIEKVVNVLLESKGRIIVTGVGKSGLIGRKITATLASTGTPSLFLHPTEAIHGDLGMVTSSDIVLAMSNSGETEEILNIIPSIRRIGAKIIAFVGNEQSTLANKSDYILSIGEVKEACPLGLAPSTSTTLMLAMGDAIAIALLNARNFKPENFAVFHPGGSIGKRLLLTVKDVVDLNHQNPITNEYDKVTDAIFKMTQTGLGATSVVDEDKRLIGILTDGDIRRALSGNVDIFNKLVRNIFNSNPIVITEEMLAVEALFLMKEKNINVLPVLNSENVPIAMIHIQDLIKLGL